MDVKVLPVSSAEYPAKAKRPTNSRLEKKKLEEERKLPLRGMVFPLSETEEVSPASSDVGDVSWNCPTAQISVTTMPAGTPMHSWQEVSVGKAEWHTVECSMRAR